MKDSHLTLRLPAELARALARWARQRGIPKSQVAREAVARYLVPAASPGPPTPRLTARALSVRWPLLPRLEPKEAAALQADMLAGRKALPAPRSP